MKETKVYVGRRNGKHAELMQRLDKALKEQHFAFVFTKQELKDHDRELVKEVCDEIKNKLGSIEDILINLGNGKEDALSYFMYILNKTQKEYEK